MYLFQIVGGFIPRYPGQVPQGDEEEGLEDAETNREVNDGHGTNAVKKMIIKSSLVVNLKDPIVTL